MPDFIIIGAQKSGTTSLYQYLTGHPNILPALVKEVHFFDLNHHRGKDWYLSNFPYIQRHHSNANRYICGESSPYYLFHPLVPKRMRELCPHVKLIVLLRNPVDRAVSHYHHMVQRGLEKLSFIDALKEEGRRLEGEEARLIADPKYISAAHWHYSYLSRGLYAQQLQRWFELFPKESLLILKAEDFFQETSSKLHEVCQFLGVSKWNFQIQEKHNVGSYRKVDEEAVRFLEDYYREPNRQLVELLGSEFDWEKIG
ncbi:MAG: sulfotransferase [Gammaproteobacteria bacterium]|nr:MAG: sulfotransferase [Gammaproteobacteria bacterium]